MLGEVQRFGLQNIDAFMFQKLGKLLFRGEALSRRDRNRTAPRHFDHRVDIRVGDRLLEPHRPERRHGHRELDRGRGVEARMAFDQQVHRIADCGAHSADDVQAQVELMPR